MFYTLQQWCSENFLNFKSLHYASEVRRQLSEICDILGISTDKPTPHQPDMDQVRMVDWGNFQFNFFDILVLQLLTFASVLIVTFFFLLLSILLRYERLPLTNDAQQDSQVSHYRSLQQHR